MLFTADSCHLYCSIVLDFVLEVERCIVFLNKRLIIRGFLSITKIVNIVFEMLPRYRNSADKEKNLTPAQCSALAYLLLMSAEDLDEFDLRKYLRSDEGLRRMIPVVKVSRRVG